MQSAFSTDSLLLAEMKCFSKTTPWTLRMLCHHRFKSVCVTKPVPTQETCDNQCRSRSHQQRMHTSKTANFTVKYRRSMGGVRWLSISYPRGIAVIRCISCLPNNFVCVLSGELVKMSSLHKLFVLQFVLAETAIVCDTFIGHCALLVSVWILFTFANFSCLFRRFCHFAEFVSCVNDSMEVKAFVLLFWSSAILSLLSYCKETDICLWR